jgi:predicted RNA-binding Zn ribbon-like protein
MTLDVNAVVPGADEAGLGLVTRLLASSTRRAAGNPERDLLASPGEAHRWLTAVADSPNGQALAGLELTARDLPALRRFRESLRDALQAGLARPSEAEPVETGVDLRWDRHGVHYTPRGSGWRRIGAVVSMELLLATASGRVSRLKTCAYAPCGYPFLDASRNQSRLWHDTAKCGNRVNLRASRARRRTGG